MSSTSYNRDDIPRELRRLIDHTDRGIEQLYQLAGKSAKFTNGTRRAGRPHVSVQTRARRDAYYYDPTHVPHSPPQAERLVMRGRRRGSERRHPRNAPSCESSDAESNDHEECSEAEDAETADYTDGPEDRYEWVGDGDAARLSRNRLDNRRLNASRSRPAKTRPHGRATPVNADLLRGKVRQRVSPTATPNRTLNYSSGTLFSSPASLTKPPYAPQPDLPSPSSFLSTSHVNLSSSSVGPHVPPWQQRRQLQQQTAYSEAAEDCDCLVDVSDDVGVGSHRAASPSSIKDSYAYRAHLAAQQSTQRPDDAATARRRRRQHRSRRFTDADDDVVTATSTSPNSSQEVGVLPARLEAASFTEENAELRLRRVLTARTSQVTPGGAERHDNTRSDASASAAMLSGFGRRWGAVFEEMLKAPPPSPPHAPSKQTTPSRKKRTTATPKQQQQQPVTSATSSTSDEDTKEDSDSAPHAKVVRNTDPPQKPAGPSPAASPTSASLHVAVEALAACHRTPPHASATPSVNASGLLLMPPSSTPSALPISHADARVVEQLRSELKAKDEAMLQLRMDHAREMAELRQTFTLERASATKHTADELATTYGIQQQLLQSSLQTERERVAEVEEQLRLTRREAAQRRMDLEDATHALTTLQSKHAQLSAAQQELVAQTTQWRAQAEKAAATTRQLEAQEKVWKAKEVDWQAKEGQLQQRVAAAEERVQQQETSAQEVLAQVEAEFTRTSQSYQDLLAEATKRMAYLEKSHRKYKVLKEANTLLKAEHAQLVESTMQRTQRHDSEVNALRAEVQELRQQLHQRDCVSQEASDSYQETLRDYKRRLELQEANAAEHIKTLQQHIDTANHTIELLRTQLEGAKQELLEEQERSQQQHMAAAQAELAAKECLAEQQRNAAAYKVRTEDIIAQQKRQLRDKDAKMHALAASAAEPLQRLREQLDDERGRRARLEEQLKTYKRKAKEAEEHAAAEIRREQLRTALLTPAAASASVPQRLLRSATATPSMRSSSTPRPIFAGVGGAPTVAGTTTDSTRSRTTSAPMSSATAAAFTDGAGGGSLRSASHRRGVTPPAVALGVGATITAVKERVRAQQTTTTATLQQEQEEHRQRQLSPQHTPTSNPATVEDNFTSTRRHPVTSSVNSRGNRSIHAPQVVVSSAVHSDHVAAQNPKHHRRPSSPSALPPSTTPATAADVRKSPTSEGDHSTGAAAVATTADLSAVSPSATVQSLSGISRSSPYTSTLLGEGVLENATAAADAVAGRRRSIATSPANPPSEGESESSAEAGPHGGPSSSLPWYVQRALHGCEEGEEKGHDVDVSEDLPSVTSAPPEDAVPAAALTTQVYTDADTQAHEERMKMFHSSALEVMRRFAGSRREALARCADIVKQTAAERRRDARVGLQRRSPAVADALALHTSESESDS
jgi:hypothetical protein